MAYRQHHAIDDDWAIPVKPTQTMKTDNEEA